MTLKHQRFELSDRRIMGFAVYGDEDGYPVVICHGTPGSRLMLQIAEPPANGLGLRLIVPDRPGYGLSSAHSYDRLLDWPKDLADLVNSLGHEQFAVVGISGGGPFALAAAYDLEDRISQIQVISSLAPLDQEEVYSHLDARQRVITRAVRRNSMMLRSILQVAGKGLPNLPDPLLQRVMRFAPGANGPLSMNASARQSMADSFREAFRHGGSGLANDLALFNRSWGFSVKDINLPVQLWHGEDDAVVPVIMGRYLADRLPNCEATFIPDAGHYWVVEHVDLILEALKQRLAAAASGDASSQQHSA